jgi:hypothetical protein
MHFPTIEPKEEVCVEKWQRSEILHSITQLNTHTRSLSAQFNDEIVPISHFAYITVIESAFTSLSLHTILLIFQQQQQHKT